MPPENLSLIRIREVCARTGRSTATVYEAIKNGEMTRPIKLGARCSAWPSYELDELIKAAIAGASRDEVCRLVEELHERRGRLSSSSEGDNS